MNLAEFLQARIDEDEQTARVLVYENTDHWESGLQAEPEKSEEHKAADRAVLIRLFGSDIAASTEAYEPSLVRGVYQLYRNRPRTEAEFAAMGATSGFRVALIDPEVVANGVDRWCGEKDASQLAEHIARHHPLRVLAEVEAKRAIIARHKLPEQADWPELRILAAIYADHEDYREEWKPHHGR